MRLGTRGSALALAQARWVAERLPADVELVEVVTTGDGDRAARDKEKWVRELDRALLDGEIDLAVHSAKDVPGHLADGTVIVGVPPRADPHDALCGAPSLDALAPGAVIGTSSVRRAAQVHALREDLVVTELRGNVDTRLRRLDAGELDAILLAVAGLSRLGYGPRIDAALPLTLSLPAVGQGALAVQCRGDDEATRRRLSVLDHADTHDAIRGERAFLAGLEGNCRTPLAAHAQLRGDEVALEGWLATDETSANPVLHRGERRGPRVQSAALGASLAAELKQRAHQ